MTNNPKDCSRTRVWPNMQARITGESPCLPPFGEQLAACHYAFLAVCVPHRRFVQSTRRIWSWAAVGPTREWPQLQQDVADIPQHRGQIAGELHRRHPVNDAMVIGQGKRQHQARYEFVATPYRFHG